VEPVERVCARVLARVERKLYSIRFVIESMKPRVPRGLLHALCLGTLRNYRLLVRALRYCGYRGPLRGDASGWLPIVLAYEAMFRSVERERLVSLGLDPSVAECLERVEPGEVASGYSGSERLAVLYSLPRWVVEELARLDPPGGLEALLRSFQEPTPQWLRFNRSLLGVEEAVEELSRIGVSVQPDPVLDDSLEILSVKPGAMARLDPRRFYVQDRSAMLVAHMLPEGFRVVDVFSAPGNKLAHGWWRRRYSYAVGLEISLRRIRDEARLLRLQGAWPVDPVAADATSPSLRLGAFDAAIVDPDCTSMGRLGHSPETRLFLERVGRRILERVTKLQRAGLKAAVSLVRRGGYIVYTTCTLTIDENEGVVRSVAEEEGLEVLHAEPLIGVWSPWLPGAQRIYPHISRCMGGFAALLRKP
jgi:16S rRNA (cytosine967-C5)-methyltransferase